MLAPGSSRFGDGAARIVGVCEDISRQQQLAGELAGSERRLSEERQSATELLHAERERFQTALAISNTTSFDWNHTTDAVNWSGMVPFGLEPKELPTGKALLHRVHPDDRNALKQVHARALESGESYVHEFRALWPDGSTKWMRTTGRAVNVADGSGHLLGVNTDVTDRKLAEEALLQTEKLAAVGRMASVISHEINNPLEAVTNLLYIVRGSPTLSLADREYLETADRELARVSQITAQALHFIGMATGSLRLMPTSSCRNLSLCIGPGCRRQRSR